MEVSALEGLSAAPETVKKAAPKIVQCKSKKSTKDGGAYGTGRRKNSVARVWLKPGNGKITINTKDINEYFKRESYITLIRKAFVETNTLGQFDIKCTVKGGGTTGQAGAIVHGLSRALDCMSDEYHSILRKGGFLTRDSRIVERKKYGRVKARRKRQFSKR
ncbi:MAG: hypothetical protein DGJ47_000876 [Rickettsiaceae bacterium]